MMWIVLFISSFFELGFTVCLKLLRDFAKEMDSPLHLLDDLLNRTALNCDNRIAPSVAYAVWTGVGTVLITLFGIAVFKESKNPLKLFFLALVLLGVIGLRLSGVAH